MFLIIQSVFFLLLKDIGCRTGLPCANLKIDSNLYKFGVLDAILPSCRSW